MSLEGRCRQIRRRSSVTKSDDQCLYSRTEASARRALATLLGSVLRYDGPTEPVCEDDWDVCQR